MSADGGVLAFGTDEQHPYAAGGFQILHAACLPAAGAPAPAPGRDAVGTRTDRATGPSTDPRPVVRSTPSRSPHAWTGMG